MRKIFTLIPAILFFSLDAGAVYTPVTLTGFNQDVVANGIGLPTTSTTAAFDNTAYCLLASDYKASASATPPTYYLPNNNTVNSAATTGLSFTLAPYNGMNSLKLTANNSSGTLTLTNNTLIGNVYLLCAGGDGSPTGNIVVNFVGGGSQTFSGEVFTDWFNNSGFAIQGIGRVGRTNGTVDATTGATNPRLYQKMLTINTSNYNKRIQSITITKTIATGSINVMAVTVDHQTCLPPTGGSAINITTNGATVKWNSAPSAGNGYQYSVTTSATPPATGTPTTDTFYHATSLNVGMTYYLHVRSNCGTSNSVWMTSSFATLPCPSAGAPVVTNNIPGSVTFEWPGSNDPGLTGYQYAVTSSPATPSSGWNNTTGTSATVNALVPGQTYYVHVRSNCGNANAPSMNVSFVNPFPPCDPVLPPAITEISMYGARLTWHPSANGVGYDITVNTSPAPPATGTQIVPDTTFVALGLAPNTQYYAHIRTHCGTTNYSGWVSAPFTTAATCDFPANITINNITASSAAITWNPVFGSDGYEYFLTTSPTPPAVAGSFILFPVVMPQGLMSNTTYYLHLRTRCDAADISPWTTASFTTDAGAPCNTPATPAVTNITHHTATVSWIPVPGAIQYEYGITTSSTPPATGLTTSNTTSDLFFLSPQTDYYFHLRSHCSMFDYSQWTTIFFTTLSDPNSVPTVLSGNNALLKVFPNPADQYITLSFDRSRSLPAGTRICIYDVTGRMVHTQSLQEYTTTVSVTELPPGIYHLRYSDDKISETIRIQKR